MTAADVLKRQAELQAARHDRRCSRDDCNSRLVRNSATELCARHWRLSQGFMERDLAAFRDAPSPPTHMSHGVNQATHAGTRQWWVTSGCVLCGGPTARVDQRGVDRGPATITRQMIGLLPAPVPFIVGARCATCQSVVRANSDRRHPVVVAVCQMLGRADFDIFALRVVAARLAGLDDPELPAERWGFTEVGPPPDEAPAPLSNEELTKELAALRSSILGGAT